MSQILNIPINNLLIVVEITAVLITAGLVWIIRQREMHWQQRWDQEELRNQRISELSRLIMAATGWFVIFQNHSLIIWTQTSGEKSPILVYIFAKLTGGKDFYGSLEFKSEGAEIIVNLNPNKVEEAAKNLISEISIHHPDHFPPPAQPIERENEKES